MSWSDPLFSPPDYSSDDVYGRSLEEEVAVSPSTAGTLYPLLRPCVGMFGLQNNYLLLSIVHLIDFHLFQLPTITKL